jgi:GDPmannose 4,6-dehydratase
MFMKALIFGGTGQDGEYLTQLLRGVGVEVQCVSRGGGDFRVDVSDVNGVQALLLQERPDVVFHLAATSSTSHEFLWANHASIGTGTMAILDAVDRHLPDTKVLLAGSGLQFVNEGIPLNEASQLDHSSPYAVARNYSLFAARYFRLRGLKVYFAFLFNHDSPLRSNRHLNMKIAEAAALAARGGGNRLQIGDLSAEKEFNFAGDIAAALWRTVCQDSFYEIVIGGGKSYSVMDWVELCFGYVGLDWRQYVETDSNYRSPYQRLVCDPARLFELGWQPNVDIRQLSEIMMVEALNRADPAKSLSGVTAQV